MRKIAFALAIIATLTSNGAFAQMRATTGAGAQAGTYSASNFAWGIGLGGLVVLGVVVGLTAGAASSSQSTFSSQATVSH